MNNVISGGTMMKELYFIGGMMGFDGEPCNITDFMGIYMDIPLKMTMKTHEMMGIIVGMG